MKHDSSLVCDSFVNDDSDHFLFGLDVFKDFLTTYLRQLNSVVQFYCVDICLFSDEKLAIEDCGFVGLLGIRCNNYIDLVSRLNDDV